MDNNELAREFARRGNRARNAKLSAEQKRKIASKAGKASARVRKRKAKLKKLQAEMEGKIRNNTCPYCQEKPPAEIPAKQQWRWLAVHMTEHRGKLGRKHE